MGVGFDLSLVHTAVKGIEQSLSHSGTNTDTVVRETAGERVQGSGQCHTATSLKVGFKLQRAAVQSQLRCCGGLHTS